MKYKHVKPHSLTLYKILHGKADRLELQNAARAGHDDLLIQDKSQLLWGDSAIQNLDSPHPLHFGTLFHQGMNLRTTMSRRINYNYSSWLLNLQRKNHAQSDKGLLLQAV